MPAPHTEALAFFAHYPLKLHHNLVLERVPHALDARAGGQHALALVLVLALPHLCNGVNNARNESNENGAAAGKRGRRVEEDKTREGNGQLVECADHGVGCRGGNAHAPCGAVRDEDGAEARQKHDGQHLLLVAWREVDGDVGRGPVLEEQGADEEDGDGEEVVVVHGWERD